MSERSFFSSKFACFALVIQIALAGCDRQPETAAPDLPVASIEREIRLGALDSPDFAFSQVTGLEVAPDGSIYSLHRQEALIRRWSEAGEAIGRIGQRGGGPGEFMTPVNMGWHADSLWVFDSARFRISFFDNSGSYLGLLSPAVDLGSLELADQGIFLARPMGLLGDGSIHGSTMSSAREVVEGKQTSFAHVRMTSDGSTIDTVLTVPIGRETVFGFVRNGGGAFSMQPFGDGVLSTLAPDGQSFLILERPASKEGAEAEFRLHRIGLDGDTIFSRSYPYMPVGIPRDTIESHVQARAERVQVAFGQRLGSAVGQVREAMYTPEFYPPVAQLVAGRDGTIWLARNPGTEVGTDWLVLDRDGEEIGTVMAPRQLTLRVAERSMIWGTEPDQFDVEYIVRYRVLFPGAE